MTEPTPAISIRDAVFRWPGGHFGIDVPQLEIARSERVFLSGPSGSGKSTLLSLICGVVSPASGAVDVFGQPIKSLNGAARDRFRAETIGVIFQLFNLVPYLSALDNILLPLRFADARSTRAGDARAEALRLSDALGLPRNLVTGARAAQLSVGQQQRVAVARALIGSPPLVIADEPTSSLDADAQAEFLDLLLDQVGTAGATLIMVSHDMRLAEPFDRRIALSDIVTTRAEAEA